MRAALFQPLDNLEQMADGTSEAIETDDYEYVARATSRISFVSTGREREAPEPCS